MNKFAKVKGHDSLIRDMSSHAIIANDESDYESYKRRREAMKKQKELVDMQNKEIQSLKSDMQELKEMLAQLIRGK